MKLLVSKKNNASLIIRFFLALNISSYGETAPQCSKPGESHIEQIVLIGTKRSLAGLCWQGKGNVVVAEVAQQSHLK